MSTKGVGKGTLLSKQFELCMHVGLHMQKMDLAMGRFSCSLFSFILFSTTFNICNPC